MVKMNAFVVSELRLHTRDGICFESVFRTFGNTSKKIHIIVSNWYKRSGKLRPNFRC